VIAVATAVIALAAQAAVSPELAVVVMLKVLTYDPAFEKRVPNDFTLVVPLSKDNAEQAAALKDIQPVGATLLSKRAVKVKPVAPDSSAQLSDPAISAVLFLPGTPASVVDQWSNVAANLKVYTLSLVPNDANDKVMLSVDAVDGKPQLVVNHRLATAAGVAFPPSVLKVAKVIR
jgi:hypothetical protein